MPVITDLYLLAENPEAEGEWVGYPETVALAPDQPFLCRLCYRFEAEEPGGFTGIETEVCFADQQGLISHIVPVGVPGQTGYSIERSGGEYRIRFAPKEPYAESAEEKIEFVVESTGETGETAAVFSSTVGFSGIFRGESGDRQISLEKPGPVWMVLEKASTQEIAAPETASPQPGVSEPKPETAAPQPEASVPNDSELEGVADPCGIPYHPCGMPCDMLCRHEEPSYCPRIVKMVPPGEFWRPDTAPATQKKDSHPYKTIGVARRQARRHFYW